MTGNELGLPFCGSGSPVHGCSTIGLAHSRNLLVSATAHYLFKTTTRSLCQMRHPIALLLANTGPGCAHKKTTPGGEFCPADVYAARTIAKRETSTTECGTTFELHWKAVELLAAPHLVQRPAKSF
jgi:hypothetical protein